MKIRSRSDLDAMRSKGLASIYPSRPRISVGMATCGLAAGARAVYEALRDEVSGRDLDIAVRGTGCLGYCRREPLVDARLPGRGRVLYGEMTPESARMLVESLSEGRWMTGNSLAYIEDSKPSGKAQECPIPGLPALNALPFYARQEKIVLRNTGLIDPSRIEEYAARGGYGGLARALLDLTPEGVLDEVTRSGLRGRGGAGFPTGRKWRTCRDAASGGVAYVICNADEGDPGAYMDRTILESDPHAVIEGMITGAYAIGAREGYVYVRDEYPLAIDRVVEAIRRAEELGLLGDDIMGTGFAFRITVVRGAGAFVCGEETALIASIEGGLGEPRPRPPFPAVSGLWGRPTVINNVKTWACVPSILERGAQWFEGLGTEGNRGTAVFSLVGQVADTGLVEVPMGITLRELVEDIGGGSPNGRRIKAVQTGGPSGGCIPAELFHLPVDYESLARAGSIMGSGGMVVMDEGSCMVDVARYFIGFTMAESCGKCTPCREGTRFIHETLTRITSGEGTLEDLQRIEEVAEWMKAASLCGLGQTAPNPVLSALRYFRDECEAHVIERRCRAGVCRALIRIDIHQELCTGCGLCRRECPVGAISGEAKAPHAIDATICTRCRLCIDVCPTGAVQVTV